ncbi:Hsp20/alpha crystallin family protein [Lentisphaerota bacterium WC36G]|nr:Hsp20/alpha crystallin family protein [Lentisphaerae bacterium WC36]
MLVKKVNNNWDLFNPWRSVGDLHYDLSSLFDMMNDQLTNSRASYPKLNVQETDKEFIVQAFLPGCKKEKINVQVLSNYLTISATREDNPKSDDEKYLRKERSFGIFEESLNLPSKVQNDNITAEYKNGILTVTLPKLENKITSVKVL